MASKTSRANDEAERVIDMAAFAPELARRRAAAGDPVLPRNAGNRRTPAKRLADGYRGCRRRLVSLPKVSRRYSERRTPLDERENKT